MLQTLFLIDMSTSILKYFSPTAGLPTTGIPSHKDTGIGKVATHEANGSGKRVLEKQGDQTGGKKWKLYTIFSDTDRAEIG